jgi:hypothetical protein
MKFLSVVALFVAVAVAVPAAAQHQAHQGQQSREIKALSPEEVTQYLAGAGMGYAKAAELNAEHEQVKRYDALRGYGERGAQHQHRKH